MFGTLLSFSLMAVCVRELSGDVPTHQTLFIRSAIGLACISLILLFSKDFHLFSTKRLTLHLTRNVFHFGGQYGWFLGIGLLPLAEVFALEFTVPLWTLLIAAILLGEKITSKKILSISLGIAGVLVILQPGIEIIDSASLIVLASAVCYGISHTLTKSLSSSESAMTVIFYMCLIQLPIGLILSINDWVWPEGIQWLWLAIIGLTALTAHYCMTKAMLYADAAVVVTLDFLRLPLIASVGIVLYDEGFEFALMVGGMIMLLANIINVSKRSDRILSFGPFKTGK
jgi:drug/metabolite transporter (DMT)-like permease